MSQALSLERVEICSPKNQQIMNKNLEQLILHSRRLLLRLSLLVPLGLQLTIPSQQNLKIKSQKKSRKSHLLHFKHNQIIYLASLRSQRRAKNKLLSHHNLSLTPNQQPQPFPWHQLRSHQKTSLHQPRPSLCIQILIQH